MHLEGRRAPWLASTPQGGRSYHPFTADSCGPPLRPGRQEGDHSLPDLHACNRDEALAPRTHCSTKCEDHDGNQRTEKRQHASRSSRRRRVRRRRVRVRVRQYRWRGRGSWRQRRRRRPMCPCYAYSPARTRGRRGSSARLNPSSTGPERAAQAPVAKYHRVACFAAVLATRFASQVAIGIHMKIAGLRPSGHALLGVGRSTRRHGERLARRV